MKIVQRYINCAVYFVCDLWLSTVKILCDKSDSVWRNHISGVGVPWWASYSKCIAYCRHIHCGYISSILKMSNDYSEWVFFLHSFKRLLKLWPLGLVRLSLRLDQSSTPTLAHTLGCRSRMTRNLFWCFFFVIVVGCVCVFTCLIYIPFSFNLARQLNLTIQAKDAKKVTRLITCPVLFHKTDSGLRARLV